MEGTYDILLGGEKAGQAQVQIQGLYCRFSCRCHLSGEVMYRISVTCGDRTEDLGILVPRDGSFVLDTRIPLKKLGKGTPVFRAVPRHAPLAGRFIPLSPEEPFSYLSKLENARLTHKNGQTGILIQEMDN